MPRKIKPELPQIRKFEMGASLHNEQFLNQLGYAVSHTIKHIIVGKNNKKLYLTRKPFPEFVDKLRVDHGFEPIIKPRP